MSLGLALSAQASPGEAVAWFSETSLCGEEAANSNFASLPRASQRCLLIERGMRANFGGRFADATGIWLELRALAPDDGAAALGEIDTAWWRLMLDEGSTRNDAVILAASKEAIALADVRLDANPADIDALYQKGAALFNRARLNGVRGNYLRAGREGERGRELLERVLALDPGRMDARYALGLYTYYTDIAPKVVKWMSWLWFVPKGDRAEGLRNLQLVRESGSLHAPGAAFILMNVHTYHAPMDLPAALETGERLHAIFPGNALFHSELVEVQLKMGLYDEAIETALALEAANPTEDEAKARLGLARILRAQALLLQGQGDAAWKLLEPMDAEGGDLPVWGGAWLYLVRGQVMDSRGQRGKAVKEYRRVLGLKAPRFNPRAGMIAEVALEDPFEPGSYSERPMVEAAP